MTKSIHVRGHAAGFVIVLSMIVGTPAFAQQLSFTDATAKVGLGGINATRMCFADVNGDGRPDAIVRAIETKDGKAAPDRYRVFLNKAVSPGPGTLAFTFEEQQLPTGLPTPQGGDCQVFADIDNDGHADAVLTRYIDANNAGFKMPENPARTAWLRGKGNGTFGEAQVIEAAQPRTTACIAVGDRNADGLLDLYLGNWYSKYGESNEAFENDLLVTETGKAGIFKRLRTTQEIYESSDERGREIMKQDDGMGFITLPVTDDPGGRPTYGALFFWPSVPPVVQKNGWGSPLYGPWLLELNYGRRWNRCHRPHLSDSGAGEDWYWMNDVASFIGLDGDADRSGKYPEWLKERGKADSRFDREDEKPFRSNGNTFDGTVGDVDGDGDFDLFLAEITHGWAGSSSDRSRFLLNQLEGKGVFVDDPRLIVDRIPADPTVRNWNMGDLFAELADFDNDGRLDLLLSSGDYPDNQRLRVYRQQDDGRFVDVTSWSNLNNEGSQQISLGDVDLDGDIDVMVGQSFNRLDAAQIAGRSPTMKLYLNQTAERRGGNSIVLILKGDAAKGVAADALGAVVKAVVVEGEPGATTERQIVRQLIGIGGHAGKQHEFIVHIPLGEAWSAKSVEVMWPGNDVPPTVIALLSAGRYVVTMGPDQPKRVETGR